MGALPSVIVSPKGERQLENGLLWVFASDIDSDISKIDTHLVQLRGRNRAFLGLALFNKNSQITARLLSRQNRPIDSAFFAEKIAAALQRRERLMPGRTSYRLIHGEADFLPGLFVDRYNDSLSIQITSWAMEQYRPEILETLDKLLKPKAIVLRGDVQARRKEGLPLTVELYKGAEPVREKCSFGGSVMTIDLLDGQKSGGYLDQIENHERAARYASGRVLDLFSYEGGFALALAPNCDEVWAVDISERALAQLKENAEDSKLTNIKTICADVFDYLEELAGSEETFDMVILDPPALARNKGALKEASNAFSNLAAKAIKVLKPGGILLGCTCSALFTEEMLLTAIFRAARRARNNMALLEVRGAGPDHPVLYGMPQTEYLHAAFWQKE